MSRSSNDSVAEHTPGPWTVDAVDVQLTEILADISGKPRSIATVWSTAADARLIAAAPAMYAELKARIEGCHVCFGSGRVPNDWVPRCLECASARDVIAKAEGRS